jgi:RNA polymerase sigma-70 factor (ECF subfamily)
MGWITHARVSKAVGRRYSTDLLNGSGGGYHGADGLSSTTDVMDSHLRRTDDRAAAPPLSSEDTIDLLDLARIGDRAALDRLLQRCIPPLRRWAHGRLPRAARGMHDTGDLVQETVMAALRRLDALEARHQGALQAYLRQALLNRIRDLVRQAARRPEHVALPEQFADRSASPLEQSIGSENLERYERALQRLSAGDREAVIARLELHYSYEDLAVVLDKPTADAARAAVTRAMKRLAREMLDA